MPKNFFNYFPYASYRTKPTFHHLIPSNVVYQAQSASTPSTLLSFKILQTVHLV